MAATKKTKAKTKTSTAPAPAPRRTVSRGKEAAATTATGEAEPTWGKSSVLVKVKGMKPEKATKLQVDLPDGSVASKKAALELAVWPAVRLRIVFDAARLWWGSHQTLWHEAAIAAAVELSALVSPTWMVQDTIDRWDDPVLKPEPFSKSAAAKHVAKTIFATKPPMPWTVLRSGGALSVRYDASELVLNGSVEVFLPPTPANAALLEKTLDALAARVKFAWAGVGYGLAGWASSLALGGPAPGKLEQKRPAMDADWLVWIGDRWRDTPAQEAILAPLERDASRTIERQGSLTRISVPRPVSPEDAKGANAAKKLAVELGDVTRKMNDRARRAALRRPVPGKKR
jgi:hypothetical protein